MADPTTTAYSRVNAINTPRLRTPISLPGVDIAYAAEYQNKIPIWATLRDCYDGETVIKANNETYLPKLSAHTDADYATYKNRAYFYNAVRRTHRGLMGSLLRKPVEVTLPDALKSRLDLQNITQDKQSFATFCRVLGHEVLLTGRFGILVDFKGTNWQKPYLAGYLAENIYSYRTREWDDREVVDRVVLLENEEVPTEYGSTLRLLIRILRLDPVSDGRGGQKLVYSQTVIRPDAPTESDEANRLPATQNIDVKTRNGRELNYIPFVFCNATDTRAAIGPAPLEDIANINISHYMSTAHLEHGRFYAGMPTYVTSGPDAGKQLPGIPGGLANTQPLTVGPQFVWELEENAKAFLLEFTGHGLTFLENAVDSKQLQMQSLGGRLISSTRRAAAMSDEAWQLLETGDEATLMDVAITADEATTRALTYMGDITGDIPDITKSGVKVEFNKEFVRTELTGKEIRSFQALAERGHIPQDVMYYVLRDVGVIPIEYTLEDFKALLNQPNQIWQPPPVRDAKTGEIISPVKPPDPAPTSGPGGKPGVRPQTSAPPANKGSSD